MPDAIAPAPLAVSNASEGFSLDADLAVLESVASAAHAPAGDPAVAAGDTPNAAVEPVNDWDQPSTQDEIDAAIAAEGPQAVQPAAAAPAQPQAEPAVEPQAPAAEGAQQKVGEGAAPEGEPQNVSVAALNKYLAASPQLKAAIEAVPGLRNQLYYNARLAERSNKYDELFQTPAMAQEVKKAADEMFALDAHYESNPLEALRAIRQRSYERDENGVVKVNPDTGMPMDTGRYDQLMGAYRTVWFDTILGGVGDLLQTGRVIKDPTGGIDISGADLQEAVRILQIATEGVSKVPPPVAPTAQPGQTPQPGVQPNAQSTAAKQPVSPEIQAQLDELARIKAAHGAASTQSFEAFKTGAENAVRSAIETDIKNLMAKRLPANSGFSDYMKDKVVKDTADDIEKVMKSNTAYSSVRSRLIRAVTRDAAGTQKVVANAQAFAREILGRKLAEVLSRATPGVVAQSKSTQQKVTTQVNRREVQSGGGVPTPTRPDVSQLARTIDTNARKAGKVLSDTELVDAVVAAQQR